MADIIAHFSSGSGNRTPGFLATVNVVSSAGVTSNDQINYYNPEFVRTGSANGFTAAANRIYFNTVYLPKTTTIRRLKVQSANINASTGVTGNTILGIYSNNPSTGLPDRLLYSSSSFAVGTGYTQNIVGSDSGLITLPPGFYHLAGIFSLTPPMFGFNTGNCNYAHYGSIEHAGGYMNLVPWMDAGSFALPSSTSGLTAYFHHQGNAGGASPLRLEFGVTGA